MTYSTDRAAAEDLAAIRGHLSDIHTTLYKIHGTVIGATIVMLGTIIGVLIIG